MQTSKTTIISAVLLSVVLSLGSFILLGSYVNAGGQYPRAVQGCVDLSDWRFTETGTVPLDGEWEFFPDSIVGPRYPSSFSAPERSGYVRLPDEGLWQYGSATYRLVARFPEIQEGLAVKMPEFFSSARVFLNGAEIFSAGTVGLTADTVKPDYRTGVVGIQPVAGDNEIVVQVSNFSERRGGIQRNLVVGTEGAVHTLYMKGLARDLVIFGSLITIGIYHLCLFWLRRKDRSTLWFGLFCAIIAIRSLIYGERFAFALLPSIPWEAFNRIDHLTFYIGIPVFSAYIALIFKRDISRLAIGVYQILGSAFALFLFFPPSVYNATVSVYEIITGGYAAYVLFMIFRALARRRESALTTVVGIAVFLCFGVNEILHNMGIVNTFNSLSVGLVLFLFIQAVLLAMRFSKAFDESENLGKTLLSKNESLRRFVPQEFIYLLHRIEPDEIMLGDQVQQDMSIMYADIRGFTSFAEQLGAAETFEFLNDYFSSVGEVIRKHGGFIDKYLGDGFIALFPSSPDDALAAAAGIQRAVNEFNASRADWTMPPIEIGIGLNFGPLILGTVGEERRMNTTVIADSVNLCNRLEGLCKEYGKGTIVPVEFLERLSNPGQYHWRRLGFLHVQGQKKPVDTAHVYDGLTEKDFKLFDSTRERFENAVFLYDQGDREEAFALFRALASENPNDPAIMTFLSGRRNGGIPVLFDRLRLQVDWKAGN